MDSLCPHVSSKVGNLVASDAGAAAANAHKIFARNRLGHVEMLCLNDKDGLFYGQMLALLGEAVEKATVVSLGVLGLWLFSGRRVRDHKAAIRQFWCSVCVYRLHFLVFFRKRRHEWVVVVIVQLPAHAEQL